MDKRFIRSEKIIKQSYIELLKVKPNKKISVSDICKNAECSRNTFYLHYESKEHLLSDIITELVVKIEESCQPVVKQFKEIGIKENREYTNLILSTIEQNKKIIQVLLTQENWQFSKQLVQLLLHSQIKEAQALQQDYNYTHLIYFTNGIVGFIEYWLTTDWSLAKAQEELHQAIHFSFQK